ncbi:MAG: hypothetical protein JSW63_12620 [Ignavibacterium sp.]|nr:MAG: hypothetical protein JSW63_12620 [Ignavibacterium sp.]
MIKQQKLLSVFALAMLALLFMASSLNAQGGMVKHIYTIDYPMGEKADYLEWIKEVASALQAPDELLSIASYDNYFNASPHRYIEFVFANATDAVEYFENPEINKIVGETVNHGINIDVHVLKGRSDYNEKDIQRRSIKYVFMLDYGLRGKTDYLNWVKSIVDVLQKPDEIRRITSYDNYYNASPNRFIEFEFDSMEDAVKYFEIPEIKEIVEKSINMSVNHKITVLRLRGDYYKN